MGLERGLIEHENKFKNYVRKYLNTNELTNQIKIVRIKEKHKTYLHKFNST